MSTPVRPGAATVVVLSAEPWDEVWRRNQHLAHQLVQLGIVGQVRFVEPAVGRRAHRSSPEPGVEVIRPPKPVPYRLGGLWVTASWLRRKVLADADRLWVNDAPLGARALVPHVAAAYDVTDDWRTGPLPGRIRARLVRAEDQLTRRIGVIVCSEELRARWSHRYGIDVPVVHNGVDADAFAAARPHPLPGDGPHAGYVGTLHSERLDVAQVLALAASGVTVHLVGPDVLTAADRERLAAEPRVVVQAAVPAADVPSWLMSFDVLICPHRVTDFTLSLDAIKSYEYLSAGRPIVATPTSGFQHLGAVRGVTLSGDFASAVPGALAGPAPEPPKDVSWAVRAREFAAALGIPA